MRIVAPALALMLAVAGCSTDRPTKSAGDPTHTPRPSATSSSETVSSAGPPPRPTFADRIGLKPGWGPSRDELARAGRYVKDLPLPDLAGQVIVASYSGTAAPVDLLNDLHLGGVIVFTENVTSTGQIADVNQALTESAQREWPLFLSVDQEGGVVERVTGDATRFPAFMSAGAADSVPLTRAAARASGAELRGLGFTVDFAPDADVTSGPDDPTIASRSASSDPETVATQVTAAVDGFGEAGIIPVIKHFPGHGSVPADSHESLPVQTKTLDRLRAEDLVPFRAGVADGVPAVMVGHLDVTAVDPGVPSSVSRPVITGLLRKDLGFRGLVVTDSLAMGGIADTRDSAEASVQALLAGADVVLMPPDPAAAREGIMAAVHSGRLPLRRLQQAAARQIALLLHERAGRDHGASVGSGEAASLALSRGAITVVSGPCEGPLIDDSVTPVGDPDSVAAFTAAANDAGLTLGGGETIAFIGYQGGATSGDVVVATDVPYPLGSSSAPVKIATYGDTPGAMTALVAVLTGEATAPGRLPVPVTGVDRTGC